MICLAAGCGGRKTVKAPRELKFEIPQPPSMLTSDQERARFFAAHFWDNMDFADTAYIDKPAITEQAFADYLTILNALPPAEGGAAMGRLMDRARADSAVYAYFAGLSEKYLYDPNSPFRNEELYIPVLQNIVAWDKVDELNKLRPESQLQMALKNRVGERAADFGFTLANGKKMKLYDLRPDFTILYFNNPDCPACAEETEFMRQSPVINQMLSDGELIILAVYPDEDLKAWREHLKVMPAAWLNAYDQDLAIRGSDIYDLRAIPSFYLLDREKQVLVKDAGSARAIEHFLLTRRS